MGERDPSSGKVSITGVHLKPHDMQALSTILYNCDHLSVLELINCRLNKTSIEAMANALRGSAVKVDVLDVSFNRNLHADSLPHLHEICQRTQGLNYWQCGFKQIDLLTFTAEGYQQNEFPASGDGTGELDIRRQFHENNILELTGHNVVTHFPLLASLVDASTTQGKAVNMRLAEFAPSDQMENVVSLIEKCSKIAELGVAECNLSDSQLQLIGDALNSKQLKALNVSLSPNIGTTGWKTLGLVTRRCRVTDLFLTACNLDAEKLQYLLKGISPAKIRKLDVSRNEDMHSNAMAELGNIIKECGVRELVMGYCRLTHEGMQNLQIYLGNAELNRLDVSGNDRLGTGGFSSLGKIVNICNVQELDISECDPIPTEMTSLKESIAGSKMTKLNVSRNRRMCEGGIHDVGRLVRETHLHQLFMRQCDLDKNTLRSFMRGLADSKIPRLDVGDYFMMDRKTTDEELKIVTSLLHNVTEELTLNKWEIGQERREFLKAALNDIPYKGLKIQLNRSVDDFIQQDNQRN